MTNAGIPRAHICKQGSNVTSGEWRVVSEGITRARFDEQGANAPTVFLLLDKVQEVISDIFVVLSY
jgi:hypothetical protein